MDRREVVIYVGDLGPQQPVDGQFSRWPIRTRRADGATQRGTAMASSAERSAHEFRPDIEGLRGVAVLLVILFHGQLLAVPGGFVGVDVFFVISGFLITGLLLRERERSGRIGFRAFYARRVRRLLPAGMVALFATLVAASILLPPLDRASAQADGAAAALSIANLRFAASAGDYFASVAAPSPVLHYWSLSVEEQFYLAWPALLFLAARGPRPRLAVGLALGLLVAGSMAVNLLLADAAVSWAFYSLPSRAWQLAIGGLLAVGSGALARIPREVLVEAGWAGIAGILVAAIVFDGQLAYPGVAALLPTLSAAALIACGTTRLGPGVLLSGAPLRFFGRISYSLYLWHWPVLILPAIALGVAPPLEARLGLIGLAIILAWLSWRFVEEPFRTGFPVLARRPGRTILAGGLAVVLVVASAGGLAVASSGDGLASIGFATGAGTAAVDGDGAAGALVVEEGNEDLAGDWPDDPADGVDADPIDGAGVTVETGEGIETGQVPDESAPAEPSTMPPPPVTTPTSALPTAATPTRTPTPPPVSWKLPRNVRPSLAAVRADEERLRRDGCLAFEGATVPPDCSYGDPKGSFTVALVGDSHAAQWFPALERVALARHWRLLTYVKVACPFVDMPLRNLSLKREYRECAAFQASVITHLRTARPDLTLVSSSRFAIHPIRTADTSLKAQAAAMGRLLARVPGRVAVIVDTPEPGRDVPGCLSAHTGDIRECAIAKRTALSGGLGTIERLAARASGDAVIDMTRRICRTWPCQVVVKSMITFRDSRHLTATFSRSLSGGLDQAIAAVMAIGQGPSPSPVPSAAASATSPPGADPLP